MRYSPLLQECATRCQLWVHGSHIQHLTTGCHDWIHSSPLHSAATTISSECQYVLSGVFLRGAAGVCAYVRMLH